MTIWTIACQPPLSMGILQARILKWLPCPPLGDLPDPGIKLMSPTVQADFFCGLSHQGSPLREILNRKSCLQALGVLKITGRNVVNRTYQFSIISSAGPQESSVRTLATGLLARFGLVPILILTNPLRTKEWAFKAVRDLATGR